MMRFFRDERDCEQICQFGGRGHLGIRHRGKRGTLDSLDVTASHRDDVVMISFKRPSLDTLATLLFLPRTLTAADEANLHPSHGDWRDNAVMIRVDLDGATAGIYPRNGVDVSRTQTINFAENQCGIGSPIRDQAL